MNKKLKSWLYVLIIISLYAIPSTFEIPLNRMSILTFRLDHLLHLIIFIPLPVFFLKTYNFGTTYIIISITLIFFALNLEFLHIVYSKRSFSLNDMVFNIIGVALGIMIDLLIRKRQLKLRK
jgi:VanZ family protein